MQDRWADHLVLLAGCFLFIGPVVLLVVLSATPGGLNGGGVPSFEGVTANLATLKRWTSDGPGLWDMTLASARIAFGVAILTSVTGFLAAFALTHFANPFARAFFWLTLLTLYFPIEARMLPTFDAAVALGLIDTLPGLVLPILPLAVATFYLRQHLRGLPPELAEAARLDGAGPLRFLLDFVLPLSIVPLATVFLIAFIMGWNQYLWPLMISVNDVHYPLMRGLNLVGAGSGPSLVIAVASMGPPLLLVLLVVGRRNPLQGAP